MQIEGEAAQQMCGHVIVLGGTCAESVLLMKITPGAWHRKAYACIGELLACMSGIQHHTGGGNRSTIAAQWMARAR